MTQAESVNQLDKVLEVAVLPDTSPTTRTGRPTGRPTKLTPQLAHRIYEYIRGGATFTATHRALGISKEVFRRWRLPCQDETPEHRHSPTCLHLVERMERRDGQLVGTGEFVAFVVLVEQALGEHEAHLALLITKAAEKDWRAALEMLRRRYPERWNSAVRPGTGDNDDAPIDMNDARARLLERIRAVRVRLAAQELAPLETTSP